MTGDATQVVVVTDEVLAALEHIDRDPVGIPGWTAGLRHLRYILDQLGGDMTVSGIRNPATTAALLGPALIEQFVGKAIAERFAAGWVPKADNGRAVWVPPKMCGDRQRGGEPEPMSHEQAEWLVSRGWSFAIELPANQVKAALVLRGWRPARVGKNRRWRMVDIDGKVVPYAKVTPEHLAIYAAGQDVSDDQLEALIEAHRDDAGDVYDRAGVPWLRDMLGGLDPRVEPIPWPPEPAPETASADVEQEVTRCPLGRTSWPRAVDATKPDSHERSDLDGMAYWSRIDLMTLIADLAAALSAATKVPADVAETTPRSGVPAPSLTRTYRRADGEEWDDEQAWITVLPEAREHDDPGPVEVIEETWQRSSVRRFWHLPEPWEAVCDFTDDDGDCDRAVCGWWQSPTGRWLQVCAIHKATPPLDRPGLLNATLDELQALYDAEAAAVGPASLPPRPTPPDVHSASAELERRREALRDLHTVWDKNRPAPFSEDYKRLLIAITDATDALIEAEDHAAAARFEGSGR